MFISIIIGLCIPPQWTPIYRSETISGLVRYELIPPTFIKFKANLKIFSFTATSQHHHSSCNIISLAISSIARFLNQLCSSFSKMTEKSQLAVKDSLNQLEFKSSRPKSFSIWLLYYIVRIVYTYSIPYLKLYDTILNSNYIWPKLYSNRNIMLFFELIVYSSGEYAWLPNTYVIND